MPHTQSENTCLLSTLVIRPTRRKGRGLFTATPIVKGSLILTFEGWLSATAELDPDCFALQVDDDLWLCSHGDLLDDCVNHSCAPNAGFTTGEPVLHALRDIAADEEISWDYSTSIAFSGWKLRCRCGANNCRGVIRSWGESEPSVRTRLRPFALSFLRMKR